MDVKSKPRRRHSEQFKAEVIAACAQPGASVAAVARQFELNDNLVHQWRRGRGVGKAETAPAEVTASPALQFVAMSLPAPAAAPVVSVASNLPAEPIRIEIRRGSAVVNVVWPASAADGCGAWLRELLR